MYRETPEIHPADKGMGGSLGKESAEETPKEDKQNRPGTRALAGPSWPKQPASDEEGQRANEEMELD